MFTRFFRAIIFICLVNTFCILRIASALPIEYRVDYDPILESMTIYNSDSSSASLMFWTIIGPQKGLTYWLSPSDTVVIDKNGNISGSYALYGEPCNNVLTKDKEWTIYPLDDSVTVTYLPDKTKIDVPPGGLTIPKGQSVQVTGKYRWTGCDIESLTNDTTTIITSDSWPGPSNQDRVELLNGSVWSIDNTNSFVSIYTPLASTGCPEPSTIILLGIGITLLAGTRRKMILSQND